MGHILLENDIPLVMRGDVKLYSVTGYTFGYKGPSINLMDYLMTANVVDGGNMLNRIDRKDYPAHSSPYQIIQTNDALVGLFKMKREFYSEQARLALLTKWSQKKTPAEFGWLMDPYLPAQQVVTMLQPIHQSFECNDDGTMLAALEFMEDLRTAVLPKNSHKLQSKSTLCIGRLFTL